MKGNLEPAVFYDPTIVALNYLNTKPESVDETDLMRDLHIILKNLLRDDVNIEIIENANPFCPYWNPQVSDELNDLSKMDVITIQEKPLEGTRTKVCFKQGSHFRSFLEKVNSEVEPQIQEKIEKYINTVNHK